MSSMDLTACARQRARQRFGVSLQVAIPIIGAALATTWMIGALGSPAVSASKAAPPAQAGVAIPTAVEACDSEGWPYVDQRCAGSARAAATHQVRVVSTDRSAPAIVFTRIAAVPRLHAAEAVPAAIHPAMASSPAATARSRVHVTAMPAPEARPAKTKVAGGTARSAKWPRPTDRPTWMANGPATISGRAYGSSAQPRRLDTLAYGDTQPPAVAAGRGSGSLFSVLFSTR